jgi:uncharacterized membrane protein YeaQ/YmgE (transglycosylase-associated protein family)
MSLADFLIMLLMAALLGALSQKILGFQMGGWILATALGFLGVLLGRWMYYQFGGGWDPVKILIFDRPFPLMWCLIGGVSTTIFAAWLSRRRRRARDKK